MEWNPPWGEMEGTMGTEAETEEEEMIMGLKAYVGAPVHKIRGHWAVGKCVGTVNSQGYFYCKEPSCPFSLKLNKQGSGRGCTYDVVQAVVFPHHFHAMKSRSRRENKCFVETLLRDAGEGRDAGPSRSRYASWQKDAADELTSTVDSLVHDLATISYSRKHPELSGREIKDRTQSTLSRQGINSARAAEFRRRNMCVDIQSIIRTKAHHLLGSDSDDILVFGLHVNVEYMSRSPIIFADRTFTCIIKGYSQLYIFHALVEDDVTCPMLFCLTKGKSASVYDRLLSVIDGIGNSLGKNIFNRRVQLVCDFEQAFIQTMQQRFPRVVIKCCFFHYVKNIRTKLRSLLLRIKRENGATSFEYKTAQLTKRRFMMLPLLPINLVTEDTLNAITDDWKNVQTCKGDEFAFVVKYMKKMYIGREKSDGNYQDAIYPPDLWNVCGQKVRTNNTAESVHSRINKKAAGRISLFRFLGIIEEEMRRAVCCMTRGCVSATNPVECEKNTLFAKALAHLYSRQNVIQFLDICSSISQLRSKKNALVYKTRLQTVINKKLPDDRQPDQQTSNTLVNIYNQLHPNNDTDVSEILSTIEKWSFKHQTSFRVEEVPDDSVLSLAEERPRKSFIETRETTFEMLYNTRSEMKRVLLDTVRTAEPSRRRHYESPSLPCPKRFPVPLIDFSF